MSGDPRDPETGEITQRLYLSQRLSLVTSQLRKYAQFEIAQKLQRGSRGQSRVADPD